jgi:RNA polymerase-binding transcription factor DksA
MQVDSADENEVADKLEELEENTSIVSQLDKQLMDVSAALERIDNGTYGNCETCGKPIEEERLLANPSARISIKHAHTA